MSIENEWREKLNKKIDSKPSVEDVILRNLYEPKTLHELKNILRKKFPHSGFNKRNKLEKKLDSIENITSFKTLKQEKYNTGFYSKIPNKFDGTFGEVTMYGFSNKIDSDLENGPENLDYISLTSYFHLIKNL